MGQIVFINPFSNVEVTGGIKTTYNHADLLRQMGFNVTVFQPDGPPNWCSPRLQTLTSTTLAVTADDVLVFPETLHGPIAQLAQMQTQARKVMFCQNQFYMFSFNITAENYAKLGFTDFIVPGEICKRALESVQKVQNISVVPLSIDPEFFPRGKSMRIVTVPRKYKPHDGLPGHAPLLQTMLGLKYPHFGSTPWELIEGKTSADVAESLGRSTIFLSLCNMEACPLTPLEAMASGCIVVGYHGIGGLEYATSQNGFWYSPEQLDEVTDTLASVIEGLNSNDPKLREIQANGLATAARFNERRTKEALLRVYGRFASPLQTHSPSTVYQTLDDTLVQYKEALARDPDNIGCLRNLGGALIDLERFEEALCIYDKLLSMRPNDFDALTMRGLILERLERSEEALASYDDAAALAPDAREVHYNRGNVLADLSRFEDALASYDKALKIEKEAPTILNNRGLVLEELGRLSEALTSYEAALKIKPNYSAAISNRELLLKRLRLNSKKRRQK
jgi:tetratricopeptide (TPR) repeat protein